MLRFLFSAGAVFTLLVSMFLFPQTAAARRCPVKEPETLLSLYQNSDAIYVAVFDRIEEGEVVETTENYTTVDIKKHFTISSTLKGQARKFFVLEDQDYRYKAAAAEPVQAVEEGKAESEAEKPESTEPEEEAVVDEEEEYEDDPAELKSGDRLLLFVKEAEEENEAARLTDYRDGIKKLSTEALSAYEARINDLRSIFSAKKISEARVIDWLIRCAEDPLTRWEGTYELLRSVRNQKWRDDADRERKERIAKGLPVEQVALEYDDEEEVAGKIAGRVDTSSFARLLDQNHKQTLANILLNFTKDSSGKKEYISGDRELIELVSKWGDPRLMGFLLDQIRAGADDPSDTSDKMQMVGEILKDEDVDELAEKYSDIVYESDDDQVEADEAEEAEQPEAESPEEALPVEESKNKQEEKDAETAVEEEKPAPKKMTYKELRADLLQKFLAECDRAIADSQTAKAKTAKR